MWLQQKEIKSRTPLAKLCTGHCSSLGGFLVLVTLCILGIKYYIKSLLPTTSSSLLINVDSGFHCLFVHVVLPTDFQMLHKFGFGVIVFLLLLPAISRFVEPIDRTSYKQWSSEAPQVNQTDDEQQEQNSVLDGLPGGGDEQVAEVETTQLSFAEVMRLVQEGKEVPGVKRLEVKASNQSPTPSRMERVLKPWESSWGWTVNSKNDWWS